MDAGAQIPDFDIYKSTAKIDLNVKTAALSAALAEVDSNELILDKAQKDLDFTKEIRRTERKESNQASLAKDKAENEFNSANVEKNNAEKNVLEKKNLCSICK